MAVYRIQNLLRASVLLAAGLSLMSCDSIREAAGLTKDPPDEFAVVSKAPLIIPPDFNLHPPTPGAVPLNQQSPTQAAQAALYGDNTAAIAASINGNYSQAEKLLLAQSGAAATDGSIRRVIAADNRNSEDTGSLTDNLLFGGSSDNNGTPVDANAEAARIQAGKNGEPAPKSTDNATIDKDSSPSWWPF